MASLNSVHLIGRLGKDPELRNTGNGNPICNMTIATDEAWKDKDGVKQERTEWHRVVAYGNTAELCANYLHKGSSAYIEGSLQTRKWQDQQGQERYTTEVKAKLVLFLDRRQLPDQQQQTPQRQAPMAEPMPEPDNVPF